MMTEERKKLYIQDPETDDFVEVARVLIDNRKDAWVQINKDLLSSILKVEDIDGLALVDDALYQVS